MTSRRFGDKVGVVRSLRHILLRHRWLAPWLVGLALLMRMVMPAGYMPVFSGQAITIALCSGYGPVTMAMPMPGMPDHQEKGSEHGKGEMPCGFSGLATSSLAGADPILLAIAIAFIVATLFRAGPPRGASLPRYLRPPLRGPPTTA